MNKVVTLENPQQASSLVDRIRAAGPVFPIARRFARASMKLVGSVLASEQRL